MERAAVVVPVRNGCRTIAACIESLLVLDYPVECYEIIVIDNGSTDGTTDVLKKFSDQISIYEEPIPGRGRARNRGLFSTKADFVAFTDADCVVDSSWLRHVLVPLRDRNVGVVGGQIRALAPESPVERFAASVHDQQRAINQLWPPYAATANWASRTRTLMAVGAFSEDLAAGEDVDLAWRLYEWGYRLIYAPDAVVYHRECSSRRELFQLGLRHGFWSVNVIKRHHDLIARAAYRRVNYRELRRILRACTRAFAADTGENQRYAVLFDLGKTLGKALGSVRFGYLKL